MKGFARRVRNLRTLRGRGRNHDARRALRARRRRDSRALVMLTTRKREIERLRAENATLRACNETLDAERLRLAAGSSSQSTTRASARTTARSGFTTTRLTESSSVAIAGRRSHESSPDNGQPRALPPRRPESRAHVARRNRTRSAIRDREPVVPMKLTARTVRCRLAEIGLSSATVLTGSQTTTLDTSTLDALLKLAQGKR